MQKAIEWYGRAAENGNSDAECDLGYCYQFGKGVQMNLNKAIELYEKSANQGNMYAQCNLGVCYEEGIGVSTDEVKARKLYKAAANQGHPGAQYKLALGYLKFKSTEQVKTFELVDDDIEDFVEVDKINFVMKWMRNAAQNGILPAQMFLGDIYRIYDDSEGKDGVSKEERKKYYQMAAEQGEPKAEYELGKYCIEDKNESMKWLQKAASQNYIDALVEIGKRYERDDDFETARKWYQRAAAKGNERAKSYIEYYKKHRCFNERQVYEKKHPLLSKANSGVLGTLNGILRPMNFDWISESIGPIERTPCIIESNTHRKWKKQNDDFENNNARKT